MKSVIYILILLFNSPLCIPLLYAQSIELIFVGDAMLHKRQQDIAFRNEKWHFDECFDAIRNCIREADLSIVNLELPLGGAPYSGYPAFCGPDQYASALKDCGFDIFLCANNHILDRHTKGALRTMQVLDSMKVYPMGIYRSRSEADDRHPLLIEKNKIRMAFLNYTYGTNGFKPKDNLIINYIDTLQIKHDIQTAHTKRADIIIATIHWGTEYQFMPSKSQKKLTEFLFRNGVTLIIGSHPHVVQPIFFDAAQDGNKTLIAYSLGNFISGMSFPPSTGGLLLRVLLKKDSEKKVEIDEASYRLLFTQRYGENWKPVSRIIDATAYNPADTTITTDTHQRINSYLQETRKLFKSSNIGIKEENN